MESVPPIADVETSRRKIEKSPGEKATSLRLGYAVINKVL